MHTEFRYFSKHKFRLSRVYKVVPFTHSAPREIPNNESDPKELFGLLLHTKTHHTRMIDCQTALLLYILQTATFLPSYLIQDLDMSTIKDLKYMLSLGIIEVEVPQHKGETSY